MVKRKSASIHQTAKKGKTEPENITKPVHHPAKEHNTSWSDADIQELLGKIEANIPMDDKFSYTCRLEKLNWENIAFKAHSVQECKDVWNSLHKPVRKYRFLREIIDDVKSLVSAKKVTIRPAKPKNPPNSYMLFVEETRPEVVHDNPGMSFIEVTKKLGQMFKNLSSTEKEKYENLAKAAKQEYSINMQKFYENHPEMIPKKTKRGKAVQLVEGTGPPTKPKTPFELFVKVESEKEKTEVPRHVIIEKCRDLWSDLSDKEKYFWINWADEMHSKYIQDLKAYLEVHPEYEPEKFRPILTKKEIQIKERCCGKPEKPPHGSYHLFSKLLLKSEDAKKINNRDLVNYIAEQWRACTAEEKDVYKVRVKQMWEDYHKKLEEYLLTLPPEDRDRVRETESRKKTKPEKAAPVIESEPPVKIAKLKKPPKSAYRLFHKKYKGKHESQLVWKAMTADEKNVFKLELNEMRKKYLCNYEKYLRSLNREELHNLSRTAAVDESSDDSESAEDDI